MIHYSVHSPSEFIAAHSERLLPEWSHPIRSIVVVFQLADRELSERCWETDLQKQKLRSQFLDFGFKVAESLKDHLVELFDPKTGFPVLSGAGSLRLDDVAVVRSTLGYTIAPVGNCLTIVHPLWGSAVYPSILMSSADKTLVETVLAGLVECHHSLSG